MNARFSDRRTTVVLAALAASTLSACEPRPATSIVLLVESDIEPTLLRRVELRVRWTDGGASSIEPRSYVVREDGTRGVLRRFPASIVVSPAEIADGREMEFSLVAMTDGAGGNEAVFTQTRVRAVFQGGVSRQVSMFLADACGQSGVGSTCTDAQTCAVVAGEARCEPVGRVGTTPFERDVIVQPEDAATELRPLTDVVDLIAGRDNTCARRESGPWLCWGEGSQGQLGNRRREDSAIPVATFFGFNPTQLALSACHGCAMRGGPPSSIACFGCNEVGQLAAPPSPFELIPVGPARADWASFSVGASATCALTSNGEPYCWGANDLGQLGNPAPMSSAIPLQVAVTDPERFTQLASSAGHTCGRTMDGRVRCWGSNAHQQLGTLGTQGAFVMDGGRANPNAMSQLSGVTKVVVGDRHSCGLLSDGRVACWGAAPQAGIFPAQTYPTAQVVIRNLAPLTLTQISSAGSTTIGLDSRGVVYCWGPSEQKQCGPRHDPTYVTPYVVPFSMPATRVVTGGSHSCALLADRSVWCWGANYSGQLGRGTRSATPQVNAQPVMTDL